MFLDTCHHHPTQTQDHPLPSPPPFSTSFPFFYFPPSPSHPTPAPPHLSGEGGRAGWGLPVAGAMTIRIATTKGVSYAPQTEHLPMFPGNNFHDDPINRSTLRKSHSLGKSAVEADFVPPTEYSNTKNPYGYDPAVGTIGSGGGLATLATQSATAEDLQEKWAPKDHPFRFVGFFKEPATESPEEEFRVRKVCLSYFPSDKTMMIREARVPNSGMPTTVHGGGGVMLRRQVVYDTDNTPLDLEDFQVGGEIEVFGRVYKIIDTDAATRNRLIQMGKDVAEPIPFPSGDDNHAKLNDLRMKRTGIRRLRTEDMDVKRIAEFALAGRYSKTHPEQTKAVKQFLNSDGSRYLTYSLVWDEQVGGQRKGNVRCMTLKYYLEDDTMEVAEHRQVNSGREGGAKFLCRQRLAKDQSLPVAEAHNTYGRLLKSNYITHGDLKIGETYAIHGKDFLLYDADEYTRGWHEKQGNQLGEPIDVTHLTKRDVKEPVKYYPPPHNGYGNEQDSLGNWRNLILKPLRQDEKKLMKEGKIIYKFKAKLYDPANGDDSDRDFVLNYYMATGDFEIHELSVKNSGVVSGKFLGKTKLYRTDPRTGERVRLTHEDLSEGAVIPVLSKNFMLLDMDERSKKYRDNIPEPPDADHVRRLIVALKELVHQKYDRLGVAMKAMSVSGNVGVSDIMSFMERHNQTMSRQEARTLVNYFDRDGKGSLDHADFIRLIEYGSSANLDEIGNRPQAVRLDGILPNPEDPASDAYEVEDKASTERALYKRTLGALRDKLLQRRSRHQEVFRLMVC